MSIIGDLYYGALNRMATRKEQKHIHQVIKAFVADDSVGNSDEINQIKTYYRNGGTSPFPYGLETKYTHLNALVLHDDNRSLPYILHNGNKLYFPRNFDRERIKFRARRLLGLISVLRSQKIVFSDSSLNVHSFDSVYSTNVLLSNDKVSLWSLIKLDSCFRQKIKIILYIFFPRLASLLVKLKWWLDARKI